MRSSSSIFLVLCIALVCAALLVNCRTEGKILSVDSSPQDDLARAHHQQEVMKSSFCGRCHTAIWAEHASNTHGRAFTDEEVRLATGRFSQADCIICHTPRPVFESGIGMNPIRRHHGLEEGNTCMTCHWKEGVDYGRFQGGADCRGAFDPRVGSVEACASCHRNHGTPYQWELSPNGKSAGNDCIDCHMRSLTRPIALGEAPSEGRSHVFPGGRSEEHVRKAYRYDAALDGNEVVVKIENHGTGHNFPTELKQRSVESLVVVRDLEGREVARSRMVFRDPYKRPYGLTLPVNTQIPAGEAREHRVPLGVASGTVECELHFKLYFPIEDFHPDLARRLEVRHLTFDRITPSEKPVVSEADVLVVTPEGITPETASPADLVDYARPPIDAVEVQIPAGASPADVKTLIDLFQFPVPEANGAARKRLVAIGLPAVPALIEALGSWDNKTWNQSMAVLEGIGEPAGPAIVAALDHPALYVRLHAAELLARLSYRGADDASKPGLDRMLASSNALDRMLAATTLGDLKFENSASDLERQLSGDDPDVARSAARSLAKLHSVSSVPALRAALQRFTYAETRRDLADALARLGDSSGMQILIDGLDHGDDLIRESFFETWFALTGKHAGYDPLAPRDQRLESISNLSVWWNKSGGAAALRHPPHLPYKVRSEVVKLVHAFGGGDGATPAGNDEEIRARLLELGEQAVPVLATLGLKFPAGFAQKRAAICDVLGQIQDPNSVPALVAALRDPVIGVASWACWALSNIGDAEALPAVQRWHSRVLSLHAAGRLPEGVGDPLGVIAQAAACRFVLGDPEVEPELVSYLLSESFSARNTAFSALRARYGADLDYDPDSPADLRREAVQAWTERNP